MTDEELKQLVESNARTAQAILDSMAEARLEREEFRQGAKVLFAKPGFLTLWKERSLHPYLGGTLLKKVIDQI